MGNDANETPRITAIMDKHHRERVQYYTRQIEADPADPNNYLRRAQQFKYLRDEDNVHADMSRYAAILGQGWFSRLRFGTPTVLKAVRTETVPHRLVFSLGRRDNGIITASIAFGQKGRSTMKPFEIPIVIASLFALHLFPGLDIPTVYADLTFGEPANITSVVPFLDPAYEYVDCFSYDGLELYFSSKDPGGQGYYDLCVMKRISTDQAWSTPENLGGVVNSSGEDSVPSISADGLELYFTSKRTGDYDIYVTTRARRDAPWEPPVKLGANINSAYADAGQWISPDGLELYFCSLRPGGFGGRDIYVARRATTGSPWGEAMNLGPTVNSSYQEAYFSLSPDGLLLLFGETKDAPWRPGGYGGPDVWISRRPSLSDPWQVPVNAGPTVNTPERENIPRISPDGILIYFCSMRTGQWKNYQAPILPVVDFNGDGTVDGGDVVVLTKHWGESDSVCDIGPYAWGDGIVDEQDLFALAEYLPVDEEDYVDPTLVAHWTTNLKHR